MPYHHTVGSVPRKKHTKHPGAPGGLGLHHEEMMGADGFSAENALLYHRHPPTALVEVGVWEPPSGRTIPNHPVQPRHLRPSDLDWSAGDAPRDAVRGRRLVLGNDDVRILWAAPTEPSPLYRDAVGDECVFVVSGAATVETVFGALEVARGDYVVLPTSTTHRWVPREAEAPLQLLIVEASGHIGAPDRYVSPRGQFLEGSPYCERDLRVPTEPLIVEGEDVEVLVRHRAGGSRHVYANHPFDVTGWDGCLYPYILNILDFEPIVGSLFQPPTTYQTFAGPNFVMCSFVPHKMEWHPDVIPVPYNHSNVDSDEVMFYFDGNFGSRGKQSGIDASSFSLHPTGFVHGPHPGAVEGALKAVENGADFVHETAVMIDTFRPLHLGDAGVESDRPEYHRSWIARS